MSGIVEVAFEVGKECIEGDRGRREQGVLSRRLEPQTLMEEMQRAVESPRRLRSRSRTTWEPAIVAQMIAKMAVPECLEGGVRERHTIPLGARWFSPTPALFLQTPPFPTTRKSAVTGRAINGGGAGGEKRRTLRDSHSRW